ncbi:MAG: DUF4149 domain-containing protein [Chlorobi bacterium]|nr:DUF4149 domain-containing protein [Chlorobiota bacterium]
MYRSVLHIIAIVGLAVMIGSLFFFGVGVAGVIFQEGVLPSRTLAGNLNVVILHRLAVMQGVMATIVVCILGYLAYTSPRGTNRSAFWLALFAFLCAIYSGLILLPEIGSLQLEIGNFDHLLEAKKEAHQRFTSLHSRNTVVVMVQLLAAAASLVLHALRLWKKGAGREVQPERQKKVKKTVEVTVVGNVGENEAKNEKENRPEEPERVIES